MNVAIPSGNMLSSAWEVFLLFTIPIGGGIPAGVLLARSRGLRWPIMMALYFVSDVVLAFIFEPMMLLAIVAGKRFVFLGRFNELMKKSTAKTIANYGTHLKPLTLIAISFGVDPMTGRVATKVAGHSFLVGWLLTIIGDMLFFSLLMVSTLWLNSVLGDGTWATVVIVIIMTVIPYLVRKLRVTR